MLRKLLIALGLLVLALVGVGVYFFYRIDSQFARDSREGQRRLEPRVITGGGQFKKSTFYTAESLGEVTEILVGWPADREGAALTVVGNRGAHFLDRSGLLKKQVRFSKDVRCPIEVTRLDASGGYGFLTRYESWAVDVILFDKQGQELWSYPRGVLKGIDDSVGGDLDGKGNLQVAIGFNGAGGVVLVDGEGKRIWQRADGNVWHVETLDTKGNGRKEILHSNARGQLLVRDASGEIIARYLPDHYVSDFALTRWGTESQASHILIPSKEAGDGCCKPIILVLDARGKTVNRFDAPLGNFMQLTKGTPVRYAKQAAYYAAVQSKGAWRRSMLFLYDADGKIAYQEILADSCLAIAALPEKEGDRLLVGCSGKIWEYSPTTEGTNAQAESDARSH
jgi:hypothetical protein